MTRLWACEHGISPSMERILEHWHDLEHREPTVKIVCPSYYNTEVADIIRSAGTDFIEHNRHWLCWTHLKVLLAIARCRLGELLAGRLDLRVATAVAQLVNTRRVTETVHLEARIAELERKLAEQARAAAGEASGADGRACR